jgi:hypothetical protein
MSGAHVYSLAACPNETGGTNLFAGTYGGGVLITTDNGTTWTATGLTNKDVLSLATTPARGGAGGTNLFAGTRSGVYLSTSNGTSWSAVDSGLTKRNVPSLAVSGSNLFAGTTEAGVWRRPLSEMITSAEERKPLPVDFRLAQNYPNPFNPSTTIKYELPKSTVVRLSVFDMLGREVCVLVDERRDAGVHEVKFDGSSLASGVYLYRLQAGDYVQAKKFVVLK